MDTNYYISTDKSLLDIPLIHGFLTQSYWAEGIGIESIKTSIKNCLCFGVYHENGQVGFARVLTDYARQALIADVFILPEYRGKGLSKRLMESILSHPELQEIRAWLLGTKDAHGLYAQYGFIPTEPGRFMVKRKAIQS